MTSRNSYGVYWPKRPDTLAYNKEGVIVEAKTSISAETVSYSLLNKSDAYDGDPQLSDEWIENSLQNMAESEKIDPDLAAEIVTDLDNSRKVVVFVRDVDGASHKTISSPQKSQTDISLEIGVDEVIIIDLQTVKD